MFAINLKLEVPQPVIDGLKRISDGLQKLNDFAWLETLSQGFIYGFVACLVIWFISSRK